MAMKVIKSTIHRIAVNMSCGCGVYAEFKDAQCKEPITPLGNGEPAGGEPSTNPLKVLKVCSTHQGDAGLSMLQFLIGERLDEAIEETRKAPAPVYRHSYAPPEIEEGDTGGVIATGGNVQSVMKVTKPIAVRERPQNPPGIKTIQRSADQLAKAGAAPTHTQSGAADIQIEEVAEDPRYTPHIEEALDFLDPKESGLLEDIDVGEDEV